MELKEFDIILDIKQSYKTEEFEVVQGDSFSNVLNISLVNGLNPYDLTGTNVEIVFSKSDGTTVQQTDIAIINELQGRIQCVLKTNTIASPGKIIAEVRVLEGETLLTSTRFEFYVRRSLMNDETIESTNEFPVLTQLINDVGEITEAVPVIEGKLDEITNSESGLNQSIAEGNTLKTDLDNSIVEGNTTKVNLDNSIVEGNTVKDELSDIIAGSDFEQVLIELGEKANKVDVGDLATLTTTDKTNLVNAINEVNDKSVDLTPVEEAINDLAGVGRTIETVKQNADDLATLRQESETHWAENASKHITESGENSNGRYIKFDDGTMIYTHLRENGVDSSGGQWVFAAAFSKLHFAYAIDFSSETNQHKLISLAKNPSYQIETRLAYYPMTSFTQRTETDGPIGFFAIGRWK